MPLCLKNFVKHKESHKDGSNEFIYSRFLAPYLMNFKGWVLFLDGDMICKSDLKNYESKEMKNTLFKLLSIIIN